MFALPPLLQPQNQQQNLQNQKNILPQSGAGRGRPAGQQNQIGQQPAPIAKPPGSVAMMAGQGQPQGKGFGNTPTSTDGASSSTKMSASRYSALTPKVNTQVKTKNSNCKSKMRMRSKVLNSSSKVKTKRANSLPTTSPMSMTTPASIGMSLPSMMNPGAIMTGSSLGKMAASYSKLYSLYI